MSYRSKFEAKLAADLTRHKQTFTYEAMKLSYVVPQSAHVYTPDFFLPNGIIVEAKGILDGDTRAKMLLVKAQHPDLDIRFVFQNAQNRIRKNSKTTYAAWATKHGFIWADKTIPAAWFNKGEK